MGCSVSSNEDYGVFSFDLSGFEKHNRKAAAHDWYSTDEGGPSNLTWFDTLYPKNGIVPLMVRLGKGGSISFFKIIGQFDESSPVSMPTRLSHPFGDAACVPDVMIRHGHTVAGCSL